ncbi:MAG: LysM peptidoglycan-binding domain-containing protein [Anaerolineae bacterium]|nr:LysM peptidoglycan-binding domain-containing protein [Anaerolineae bacterium]
MRQRLSIAGSLLLVIAMAMSLAGCTKEAPTRTPAVRVQATQPGVPPAGLTPEAGETVVSVFTPLPAGPGTPTAELVLETPAVSTPVATAVPDATAVPVLTPVPPSGEVIVHIVQPGETLYSIAYRYGTTVQAVVQANGITNPDQIYQGQKLNIPTSGGASGGSTGCRIRHVVKSGEWVWQIARNYGVSPYDILAANGMTIQTANSIYPGMVLCIP